jgi:ribonuclease P protein component
LPELGEAQEPVSCELRPGKLRTRNSMETLKKDWEFERVRREGRTWASGVVVLNAAPNDGDRVRCGFIAGKKVGGAVQRNRARRLMREAVRVRLSTIKPGHDLVWIARAGIGDSNGGTVGRDVEEALRRGKLWISPPETNEAQSRIIGKGEGTVERAAPVGDATPGQES